MFFLLMFIALALVLVFYIVFYSILLSNSIDDNDRKYSYDVSSLEKFHYKKKNYLNDFDSEFAINLKNVVDKYDVEIVPYVKLKYIVNKTECECFDELNDTISFGIFSKDFKHILLLINMFNNDTARYICKKSRINYMELKTNSSTDLKHIKSRIEKALKK